MLLVNTSSPDRSLSTLLRLYARVKERVPGAKLEWAYGWDVFDVVHGNNNTIMGWKAEQLKRMDELGVVNRGRVSHREVADMYKRARVFAYPTEFAEIDCISARKAQAAGAIPITTDFAALDETVQFGVKVHSKKNKDNWNGPYQFDFGLNDPEAESQWVDWVVATLLSEGDDTTPMREWTEQFDWDHITKRWNETLCA
jgi:glycosyltransferase involved in cell wall biosynthesis